MAGVVCASWASYVIGGAVRMGVGPVPGVVAGALMVGVGVGAVVGWAGARGSVASFLGFSSGLVGALWLVGGWTVATGLWIVGVGVVLVPLLGVLWVRAGAVGVEIGCGVCVCGAGVACGPG